MTTERLLYRNTKIDQLLTQVSYLLNPAFQIIKLCSFIQSNSQRAHITTIHTAVSYKTFKHNIENSCLLKNFFVVKGNKTAHIHQSIFFGTHRHAIAIRKYFFGNFLNGFIFITRFPFFDEIGIFGKTGCVKIQWNTILFA